MGRSSTPREDDRGFGARLARFRVAAGLTQEAFGARVGLSQRMVAYWEIEADRPPPADQLAAMAGALGVTADELLGLADPPRARRPADTKLMRQLMVVAKLPRRARQHVLVIVRGLATEYGVPLEDDDDTEDAPPAEFSPRRRRRPSSSKQASKSATTKRPSKSAHARS